MSPADGGAAVTVAGVRVTSPDRVLFEELGLTKESLARYYEAVADALVPDLKARPLSLVRCPQGPGEGCFYQKHIDKTWSAEIERVVLPESDGEGIYPVANTIAISANSPSSNRLKRRGASRSSTSASSARTLASGWSRSMACTTRRIAAVRLSGSTVVFTTKSIARLRLASHFGGICCHGR